MVRMILEDSIRRDIRPEVSVTVSLKCLNKDLLVALSNKFFCKVVFYQKQVINFS